MMHMDLGGKKVEFEDLSVEHKPEDPVERAVFNYMHEWGGFTHA
jgi:hypothetical protein